MSLLLYLCYMSVLEQYCFISEDRDQATIHYAVIFCDIYAVWLFTMKSIEMVVKNGCCGKDVTVIFAMLLCYEN